MIALLVAIWHYCMACDQVIDVEVSLSDTQFCTLVEGLGGYRQYMVKVKCANVIAYLGTCAKVLVTMWKQQLVVAY